MAVRTADEDLAGFQGNRQWHSLDDVHVPKVLPGYPCGYIIGPGVHTRNPHSSPLPIVSVGARFSHEGLRNSRGHCGLCFPSLSFFFFFPLQGQSWPLRKSFPRFSSFQRSQLVLSKHCRSIDESLSISCQPVSGVMGAIGTWDLPLRRSFNHLFKKYSGLFALGLAQF